MEKEFLTNEALRKRFKNQFDLVNSAIGLATDRIHVGQLGDQEVILEVLNELRFGENLLQTKE